MDRPKVWVLRTSDDSMFYGQSTGACVLEITHV